MVSSSSEIIVKEEIEQNQNILNALQSSPIDHSYQRIMKGCGVTMKLLLFVIFVNLVCRLV